MRAWLLLLAVLATSKPFVQVASTEDITSRFYNAISATEQQQQQQQQEKLLLPQKSDYATKDEIEQFTKSFETVLNPKTTQTTALSNAFEHVFDITALSTTRTNAIKSSATTKTSLSASSPRTLALLTTTSDATAPQEVHYQSTSNSSSSSNSSGSGSDSDSSVTSAKQDNNINKNTHNSDKTSDIIIEIKNIEEVNGVNADSESVAANALEARKIQKHYEQKIQHQKQMQQQLQQHKAEQHKIATDLEIRTKDRTEAAQIISETYSDSASSEEMNSALVTSDKMAVATIETHKTSKQVTSATNTVTVQQHRHAENAQQQQENSHHHEEQNTLHEKNTQIAVSTNTITKSSFSLSTSKSKSTSTSAISTKPSLSASSSTTATTDAIRALTHTSLAAPLAASESVTSMETALQSELISASTSASASDSVHTTQFELETETETETETESELDMELESESEPATYSNKELISEKAKPDPSTLVEIENSLLSLFNMKKPPKIDRSKIIIPEAMKKLYAQIMGHELDSVNIPKPGILTKSANTVRSFTHQESKIDDRFPHHHRFRLYFDVKSIPADEKLKAAELQLTRDAIDHKALNPRLANRTRYQVLVYDIIRVGIRGKREPSYLLLDNKMVRLNSTDTLSLDVQPAVERWLQTPKKNYGLLIEVRTTRSLKPAPHPHVRLRRSLNESQERWQHKQPLLFTYTDDGRHKSRSIRDVSSRSKRAGHHRRAHRRKNNEEICRRHSLYVDFADVGWSDWIVAPPGYDAFYCHGKCPFPLAEHLNSTNHAVVQTLVNNINPGKVPKACCVPTQLEGISMLYLNDQSTVVLKNYQDMTVVGCGCR